MQLLSPRFPSVFVIVVICITEVKVLVLLVVVEAINLKLSVAPQNQLLVDSNSTSAVGTRVCHRQFLTWTVSHH
jgi:hypothetical protein